MPPRVFKEDERENLRIMMMDQVIPLLEEYGLKHMSVEKITGRVGIAKSTFYNFFKSKEEYVSYALEHNRKKILDNLDKMYPADKKMKPVEVFNMWFKTLLSANTVYRRFSAEDEKALYEADKARGKEVSLQRETYIAKRLMSHMEGVRPDMNIGLVANYIKLIVLAYENSYMFHESEMENMENELKTRLIQMIFEKETAAELVDLMLEEYKDGKE